MKNSFFQILITMLLLAGCALHHASAPVPTASSHNPYSSPLSTPGARFGALPQVVKNTVRTEAGTAEIVDVRKETSGDRPFYKISFRDAGNFPPMYVGVDGSVLNPDLSAAVPAPLEASLEVKLSELPAGMRKVVKERQSDGEITSVSQENWGNHTVYVVSFKDEPHHQKLYIVADGTMLIQALPPTK